MDTLEHRLLNDYQRDFPLQPAPFAEIATHLDTSTQTVLQTLAALCARGVVSRVGPVFRPHTIGVSTLAAAAIAEEQIDAIAATISEFPEVNHNYRREHRFNLWFVANAPDQHRLEQVIARIERRIASPVLRLPLVKDYHIDLGFPLAPSPAAPVAARRPDRCAPRPVDSTALIDRPGPRDHALIAAIERGLPLVRRPFAQIGRHVDLSEAQVIERIRSLLDDGVIKRLGVVVRHRELGYRANAMVVWDVPDRDVDSVGERLAQLDCVTLCYQRPRRPPDWPYNLFCMIHGKARDRVLACIDEMVARWALQTYPRSVLFSTRRYKQRGAWYLNGHAAPAAIARHPS